MDLVLLTNDYAIFSQIQNNLIFVILAFRRPELQQHNQVREDESQSAEESGPVEIEQVVRRNVNRTAVSPLNIDCQFLDI